MPDMDALTVAIIVVGIIFVMGCIAVAVKGLVD